MVSERFEESQQYAPTKPNGPAEGSPARSGLQTEQGGKDPNETVFDGNLSDRQVAALPFLAAAPTQAEGIRSAEISKATYWRWRQDPVFRDELRRMREDAATLAHVELNGLALKGTAALAELLDDPNPRVRTQAVRLALDLSVKLGEATQNRRRINQLQKALTLLKNVK